MSKVVLVTNIPAPYREKVHEGVSAYLKNDYTVIYCSTLEPNREWKFNYGDYKKIFLTQNNDSYIHNNLKIWKVLNNQKPKFVITTGFNPTMIYAFIWCILNNVKHIPFSDGTLQSERKLSLLHRLVRKMIFLGSESFIGASKGSVALYKSYKIPESKIFTSCLCIDNNRFKKLCLHDKKFDLMFSGQLIDLKMPFFFVEIAKIIKERRGTCRVLIIGNGPLKAEVLELLHKHKIDFEYPGFIDQSQLPNYYSQAKILLFPTKGDAWGIVANEAMASGMPVVTCINAGVANDLVIHNYNGYVLSLDLETWVEHILNLLNNVSEYNTFSKNSYNQVQAYNFESASLGIINAIQRLN